MILERKSIPVELKDLDLKEGVIQAYAAAFGNWDDDNDLIEEGAFKKTIKERGPGAKQPRVKYLFNHDPDAILGVPQTLKEDSKGLYFEARIVPTTLGLDTLKLYEAGVITEHSIGYDAITVKYDEDHPGPWGPGRVIKELRLWDISAVTWGMNSQTPTVGVKDADSTPIDGIRAKLAAMDSLLRNGTLASDDLCARLEAEAKLLSQIITALRTQERPDDSTSDDEEPRKAAAIAALAANLRQTITTFGGNSNGR